MTISEKRKNMNITLFLLLWDKLIILLKYHVHNSNNGVSLTKEFCNSIGNLKLGGMHFSNGFRNSLQRQESVALTSAMQMHHNLCVCVHRCPIVYMHL